MTRFTLSIALAAAAAGCGVRQHPVSGRVQFPDGAPLAIGRVTVSFGNGLGATGWLRPDGTFDLGTHAPTDGLEPGTYKVAIDNAVTPPPGGYDPKFVAKPLIHPRFANPETSGLTFEVPRDREWVIVVEKP